MSVSNGQLANAATFNGAFVSKTADSTVSATITQDKESVLKEIATPSTPASGYGKIYFKNDGKLYQLNDAGIETEVGSGAGGGAGGVNFISNGNAEDNVTTGWATYADTAGTSPVDGTGGTANVTITSTATTPLAGTYSFLLAKDAVNRQGQGWSYDFSIDATYKAKVLQISFDYLVNSGTFAAGTSTTDSDVTVWIYDVTNAQVIQGSSYKLLSNSTSLTDTFRATFQSASNSTSYRLIFHVGSTSASAYTLEVDNVSVSPSVYAYGTPVTDWQAYTPTLTGFGTATNVQFQWRRVGSDLEVRGKFTAGTSTATEGRASFPSGLTSGDTSLIPSLQHVGMAASSATAANSRTVLIEPSVSYFTFGVTTSGPLTKANGSTLFSSGETCAFFGRVPIQGWSSSVQTSDQTDTRVVAAAANTLSSTSITANTALQFTSTTIDTHGAITTGAGYKFTAPVAGNYRISCSFPPIASGSGSVYAAKNGSFTFTAQNFICPSGTTIGSGGSIVLPLLAGDTIQFAFNTGATANSVNANFGIDRVSGPSAIAASETIVAQAASSAGTVLSNGNTVVFGTENFDSHGSYDSSTGIFTAPISGTYEIGAFIQSTAFTPSAGNQYGLNVCKNGTSTTFQIGFITANAAVSQIITLNGSALIKLNAGDTLRITVSISAGTMTLINSVTANAVNIKRVGN